MVSDYDSSDDELDLNPQIKSKKLQRNFDINSESEEEEEDEIADDLDVKNKEEEETKEDEVEKGEEEEEEEEEEEAGGDGDILDDDAIEAITNSIVGDTTFGLQKVKKLSSGQLEKEEKKIKKSGVVYMSSIPPYMKPQKIRHIMSRFGEVGRIYLKPEDAKAHKSRVKQGGNKKKKFDEGWVEFVSKKEAKLAAETLNGDILGGKKRSFYHDDVLNVKYLKGFKWFDLTNALNREIEVRESKKQTELSQANKINKQYIKNIEQSKNINRIQSQKRKATDEGDKDIETERIHRNFKQNAVVTLRANADSSIKSKSQNESKISSVLDSIF